MLPTLNTLRDEWKHLDTHDFSFSGIRKANAATQSYSENNPQNYTFMENVKQWLLHAKLPLPMMDNGVLRIGDTDDATVFINGMLTTLTMAKYQQDTLSELLGRSIELLHNPSEGFIGDIIECIHDRTHDRTHVNPSVITQQISVIIEEKLRHHPKVMVIGYSQGAIIASRALHLLRHRITSRDLSRVHFVSFAPGFREHKLPYVYAEHFCNGGDPVCKIGALSAKKNSGKLFYREATGHLLVSDYLHPITQGGFGTKSRFYQQLLHSARIAFGA